MPSLTHNTPALRFPGYTGVWEQHQLNDYCGQLSATLDPQKTPNSIFTEYSMPAFDNGEIPNIVTGDTMNSTRKILDRSCLLINKLNVRKKRIWLVDKPEDNAVSSAEFIPIYSDEISLKFLKYSVSNESFTTYLEECSSGSSNSQKRITPDVLMSAKLSFPSRREQDAIGQLMTILDDLLALHQRQTQKLKKLKQGLLQNMFPREGESVPRLRFPGFTTNWKQQRLGNIATFINGRAYSQDELLEHGRYPVLRVGNFYTNDSWYYSDLELADKYYAHDGDLLYTWSATFGPHIWHGDTVIYHYHIWKIDLSHALNKLFALYLLEYDKNNLLENHNGSTMVHITKSGIENEIVLIPSDIQEQAKIGSFFNNLDDLINLHEQYIVKLTQLKKGLLQKMFPQD